MKSAHVQLPGIARALLAASFVALVVALPIAVELSTPDDAFSSAAVLAASGDVVAVAAPLQLTPLAPIRLEQGTLQAIDRTGVKPGEAIPRLQLDTGALQVDLRAAGAALPAFDQPAPLVEQLLSLNFGTLSVRRTRLEIAFDKDRRVTFTDIAAEIATLRKNTCRATGTATFNGQPIRFEATWSIPADPRSATTQGLPLKLTVRGPHLDASFEGRLVTGDNPKLLGNADFRSRRLRALARWFGLPVPMAGDLRDASIVSPFEWSDGQLVFSRATISVDGNKGDGALTLKTRAPRPSIEGTLGYPLFDLRPQLAAQMSPVKADPTLPDVDGSLPKAFDADLRLSAVKVVAPNVEAGRGAVTLTLTNGRMLADLAELEIEGGTLRGQLTLDVNAEPARFSMKSRITEVDPGRVFADGLKRNPLLGRARIALEGTGTGVALPEMIANFTGKGTFALSEGGRLGLDLKALAYAARKANQIGWAAAGKGGTQIDSLDARFQLSNSALSLDQLQARSGPTAYAAGGKIDLRDQLLDVKLTIAHEPTATSNTMAAPGAHPPQDVLIFRGTWADPAIGLLGRPFTTNAPMLRGATAVTPHPVAGRE